MAEAKDEARAITVEARDLVTDAPVPDVRLQFKIASGETLEITTDASGAARLLLPDAGKTRYFNVRASREGFVPLAIPWHYTATSPTPPEHLLFQMEKGAGISGRVLDQDQQPIADATVVIRVSKRYPRSEQRVDANHQSTKTDADGRWAFSNVPEQPDSVDLATYHHLCLTDRSFYRMERFMPISALRDGSAVLRLRRGTRIEGTVLGPGGQPVSDAEVFNGECGRAANSIPPVRTDSQGRFTLGIEPGVSSNLIAVRAGFGPALQSIRVGTDTQQVTLTLQPPHTLSGRVVDRAGKPIAGARLFVTQWRGRETLAQELTCDPDGRFLWKDAPSDELRAEVFAGGYVGKRDVSLTPDAPNEVVLSTPTTVKGAVLDADTGRPISEGSSAISG
jgi:protocatechuate 3,4-dioxygenase beta subunit